MVQSLTQFKGVKQTADLIVSSGRGNDISQELRPVFRDVANMYSELCGDLGSDGSDLDNVVVEAIITEVAAPAIDYFGHWFDVFASIMRGDDYAGRYQNVSRTCITVAFKALAEASGSQETVEQAVITRWMEILTFS